MVAAMVARRATADIGDGGGGASDVREGGSALSDRIVVAGGAAAKAP